MNRPSLTPRVTLLALLVVLALATIALLGGAARSQPIIRVHGDAGWIMREPAYKDLAGVHCCGPSDCVAEPLGAVTFTPAGWLVAETGEVLRFDAANVYQSADHQFWRCRRGGETKCLFVPGGSA